MDLLGKSTVAANLALALRALKPQSHVGLMDADVFGPSVPQLLNISGIEPETTARKLILPIQNYGLQYMSLGSLVKANDAAVLRGPIVFN